MTKVTESIKDADNLVQGVKVQVGIRDLDKDGKPVSKTSTLERPIHKLTLVLEGLKSMVIRIMFVT